MAKKKSELLEDRNRYYSFVDAMRLARDSNDFQRAIALAVGALDYVDGMMQYERRFEDRPERKSLECVDCVLQFAPLVFDVESLNTLAIALSVQKRIDKNTSADLAAGLANALALMKEAHALWDYLERNVDVRQDTLRSYLGGDQNRWRWIAEMWDRMGLVQRTSSGDSHLLTITTRMESEVRAKCSSCGVIAKAAIGRFWEQITCPKCRACVYFVILVPSNE